MFTWNLGAEGDQAVDLAGEGGGKGAAVAAADVVGVLVLAEIGLGILKKHGQYASLIFDDTLRSKRGREERIIPRATAVSSREEAPLAGAAETAAARVARMMVKRMVTVEGMIIWRC
jgi:hypothetical protein